MAVKTEAQLNTDLRSLPSRRNTIYNSQLDSNSKLVKLTLLTDEFIKDIMDSVNLLPKTFFELTDAATVTWDYILGFNAQVTIADNRTLVITNAEDGDYGTLKVTQDAIGSRTLALPANSKSVNGGAGAIALTPTAGATDTLHWFFDGTDFFWTSNANYT